MVNLRILGIRPFFDSCPIWLKSKWSIKGVRYDLEMHLRVIKISELTIVGPLSSQIKSLNRYNLWFMINKLCEKDGFLLKKRRIFVYLRPRAMISQK